LQYESGDEDYIEGVRGAVKAENAVRIIVSFMFNFYYTWVAFRWRNMLPPDTDSEEEVAAPKGIELTQLA